MTGLETSLVGFRSVFPAICPFRSTLSTSISSLWNYNPDNDDTKGDDWNGENFSWFARRRALPKFILESEQTSNTLDHGARILEAIVRPYPAKTAGIPLSFKYEMNTGEFTYSWSNSSPKTSTAPSSTVGNPPLSGNLPLSSHETEIFVPWSLTEGRKLVVKGLEPADKQAYDPARQTLYIVTADCDTPGKRHQITVSLQPGLREAHFEVNDFLSEHGPAFFATITFFVSFIVYWAIAKFVQFE